MASGLFTIPQFKNRGIIKLAPDVLVYVSGSFAAKIIAPVSSKSQAVNFNDGITNVTINNTIEPGQSTASIQITTPIYGDASHYWVTFPDPETGKTRRIPYFVPMMEVKIYLKGRFLSDGQPRYYPAFWGLINTVEENFSGGVYTLSLNCVDMLHWWHWSTVNIHPVPATDIAVGGGLDLTPWSTIFKTGNPYVILWRLADLMGESLFIPPTWVGQKTPLSQSFPASAIKAVNVRMMDYWKQRLPNIGNLLKMYGMAGGEVKVLASGTGNNKTFQVVGVTPTGLFSSDPSEETDEQHSKDQSRFLYGFDDDFFNNLYLTGFSVFAELDKMGTFEESEYMTKLEIATHVRDRCEFEFFQDVNGNFIFKPPYFNMNTKYTFPYVIKPYDIISNSFQTDAEGIVTSMQVRTPFAYPLRDAQYPSGIGYHIDVDLASKYGIRHRVQNAEWVASAKSANQLALGYMALINSKCTTGTLTIPGRPELRLGYPIFIDHRDSFHYVRGISHAFDYGGTFTTSLTLEAERMKQFDENGNIYKDYLYLFKGPDSNPVPLSTKEAAIEKSIVSNVQPTWAQTHQDMAATKVYGVPQGRYELVSRKSMYKQENSKAVNPISNIYLAATPLTAPFTDEEGYKVIGAFQYGRGLPYSFERAMFVIDDAAGYERESYTMGALHRQQFRNRVVTTKNAAIASDSAAQANAAQAESQTAEAAGSTPTAASSKYSNLPQVTFGGRALPPELSRFRRLPQTAPAPTTTAPTTPEAVTPTAAPEPGSGANISTWDYEGAILAYLDDTNIDQGKDDITTPKAVTNAGMVQAVTNPPPPDENAPSPSTLDGITQDNGIPPGFWSPNNIGGKGLSRVNEYSFLDRAPGVFIQNGARLGQQGAQTLPDENLSLPVELPPNPPGTEIIPPINGKITPSTGPSGQFYVYPRIVTVTE